MQRLFITTSFDTTANVQHSKYNFVDMKLFINYEHVQNYKCCIYAKLSKCCIYAKLTFYRNMNMCKIINVAYMQNLQMLHICKTYKNVAYMQNLHFIKYEHVQNLQNVAYMQNLQNVAYMQNLQNVASFL